MPRSLVNPLAQADHERRDSHLSVVSHTEDVEEKGRRMVLGLPELSNAHSTHNGDSSCATEPQDPAVEAAKPGRQRQDSSEGVPSPSGQALEQWHGKGKHVSAVRCHYQRQGRDHWDQQGDPKATDDRREDASLQPNGGGTHRSGPGTGRDRRSQEIAGGSPFGSTSGPEQSDRKACPVGEAMEEMVKIKSLMEANLACWVVSTSPTM